MSIANELLSQLDRWKSDRSPHPLASATKFKALDEDKACPPTRNFALRRAEKPFFGTGKRENSTLESRNEKSPPINEDRSKQSQFICLKLEDRESPTPTGSRISPRFAVKRAGCSDVAQVLLHGLADRLPGYDVQLVEHPSVCTDYMQAIAPAEGSFALVVDDGDEARWWTFERSTCETLSEFDLAAWLEILRRNAVGEMTRRPVDAMFTR